MPPDQTVQLKDVAELRDITVEQAQQLQFVELASSLETYQLMSRTEIMKKMNRTVRQLEMQCKCKVHFKFPQKMVTQNAQLPLFQSELVRNRIRSSLQKKCADCVFEISELKIIRGAVPISYKTWNLVESPEEWRGPSMIRIYFDDQPLNPLVYQTVVKVYRKGLTLKHAVSLGQILNKEDIEEQLQEITYSSQKILATTEVIGHEFKRSLNKGHILGLEDVAERNVVRLGQSVLVEVNKGQFSIEMSGTAQKNGKLGEKIPIKIVKTQKQVFAEVVGESRVRF